MDAYDAKRLFIFAVFGLMTVQYTYLVAISLTNSGTATVLQYSAPIFILAWSCLTFKRLPYRFEAVSIICVLVGVFLLATHGNPTNLALSPKGLFWGLISALALALYTVLPQGILSRHSAMIVTGWGMLIAGLVFTPFVRPWDEVITWDGGMIFGVFGLVMVGTVMSFSLFLLRRQLNRSGSRLPPGLRGTGVRRPLFPFLDGHKLHAHGHCRLCDHHLCRTGLNPSNPR